MNRFSATAALALVSAVVPAFGQGYGNDFNAGAATGWTDYSPLESFGVPSTIEVSGGSYRVRSDASNDVSVSGIPLVLLTAPSAANTPADFVERVDVLGFDGRQGQLTGLGFRMGNTGFGTTRGYFLFMGATDTSGTTLGILFNRVTAEHGVQLGPFVSFPASIGEDLRLEVEGHGVNFTGRIYRLSNPDVPVATVSTFSNYYSSGSSGMLVCGRHTPAVVNCPLDVTFDNFSIVQPCGRADMGGQGGVAGADGRLDNNDFIVFIDRFFRMDGRADLGSQGGVAGADSAWDNNDFVVYIDQFFQACP